MDIKEAINHCYEKAAKTPSCECSKEHLQLARWLEELRLYKEQMKDEFDHPIKDLYGAAIMLCLAIGIADKGCDNCPVVLFSYEKRTEEEKMYFEPCQTNLYKWLLAQAEVENMRCDNGT